MHYVNAKSILSSENGINVYRGCSHGCIYCDSRSKCYGFTHGFEDIEVKQNAPELLEAALRSKRKKCMIGTGSMCDPYLHIEETELITRKCLEIIYKYGFGVTVLTKSVRIMRDIDLLEAINRQSKCVVQTTMTTYDETLCRIIEPNVSTTRERFEVLKECRKRHIPTVVWLCPILPFINDTAENLNGILNYCTEAGVNGIINFGMGVTLRDGNREYFYAQLDKHFPGTKEKYIQTFGTDYEISSPNQAELMRILYNVCRKYDIMSSPEQCFAYLHDFPNTQEQLSLF